VLAEDVVVARIFKANASALGVSWMGRWPSVIMTIATPMHEYAETREEAAMAAFAKSWRRE
jgi:hypothetical protein